MTIRPMASDLSPVYQLVLRARPNHMKDMERQARVIPTQLSYILSRHDRPGLSPNELRHDAYLLVFASAVGDPDRLYLDTRRQPTPAPRL